MVEIKAKVKEVSAGGAAHDRLVLAFDERTRSRLRTRLASGEEAMLNLPRGEVLRGGDRVATTDGRLVEVVSRPEALLHIEAPGPLALARIAYHLGNRHVPVQVGDGFLRIASDHVLEDLVKRLGAAVAAIEAPFEPEAGAYAGGHRHDEMGHGGRIHEFGAHRGHEHDHHDHHHHHGHDPHGHSHE